MNNMFYFLRFPIGLWMLGFSFSATFSQVMWFRIGGATVTILLMVVAMLLCRGRECRLGFFADMQKTASQNKHILILLTLYYIMVVASWFRAPYEVKYEEWSFIWKQHIMDILEIMVVFYLCQNPQRIRLMLWLCFVANLIQFSIFKSASDYYGIAEARGFLGEAGNGALGRSTNWQSVVMFALAFAGYLMTERNKILKIIGFSGLLLFPHFILKAGFATPVLVGFMGCIVTGYVYLRYGNRSKAPALMRLLFLIGIVVIVCVAFFRIANRVNTGETEGMSIAARFADMLESRNAPGSQEESYGSSRTKLMLHGLNSFIESPIFGKGGPFPSKTSIVAHDHQAITDYLAHFGLIGGGSFIAFVIICISYTVKRYKIHQTWQDAAAVGVVAIFLLGGVFNPMWYSSPLQCMLIFCLPFKTRDMYSLTGKPVYPQMPMMRIWG
jgi:hypothetical protein